MGDQNFLIMLCVIKDMQEKNQPENLAGGPAWFGFKLASRFTAPKCNA